MPAPNPAWLWGAAAPGDPRQDISAAFVPLQECSTPSSNKWKVIFFLYLIYLLWEKTHSLHFYGAVEANF